MTHGVRATLRAVGQLGTLATSVNLAVSTGDQVISEVTHLGRIVTEPSWRLFFYGYAALAIVAGLVVFWASSRPDDDRRNRRIALGAAAVIALLDMAELLIFVQAVPVLEWWFATRLLAGEAFSLGVVVCLVLSYRGRPLDLGETGVLRERSPWIWMVIAPLAGFDVLVAWLENRVQLAEVPVVGMLVAGLLYGLLRHRHPLPGAARWSAATWPLIALMIPVYVTDIAAVATSVGDSAMVGRRAIAAGVAVVILTAVAGAHRAAARREASSEHAAMSPAAHSSTESG